LLEAKNEEEATQINGHNEQEQNGNGLFHGVKIRIIKEKNGKYMFEELKVANI
jgi:hypothetical protein